MNERRFAFRRTRRVAVAVAATAVVAIAATAPGAAAPAQEPFNRGQGSATALGYKVNPINGNLSFGITIGESIAAHQNTGATGQSRAINLGVIGVTLAAEACDGGDPTLPQSQQPQPVIVSSGDEGAAEGKREAEAGVPAGVEKFARATPDPFAEAITSIAPLGDPKTLYVSGGRTITHSGVVGGNVREAVARTELGSVRIAGIIELDGLVWEAVHRSGAVEEATGSFRLGSLSIAGTKVPIPEDLLDQAAALNALLEPLGVTFVPPQVRVENGIVFVDPLKVGVIPNPTRDGLLDPLLDALQPGKEALTDLIVGMDCSTSTYFTVADLVVGAFSGAGALLLELGGVQATTGAITQFQFGQLPALAELPPVSGLSSPGSLGGARPTTLPAPAAAPPAAASTPAAPETADTAEATPIVDLAGERGGLLALIGGGGLVLLLATAEADRRKMRAALRAIPLEA